MASVHIVGGRSGTLRPWLLRRVAESRAAGRRVTVFVPEQYTLQAERDLMAGLNLPGLLDLDVLSPTKWKTLIRERAGASELRELDGAGRAMALHRAMNECAADLLFYNNPGASSGTVPRMEQTLEELREEDFTPERLAEMSRDSRGAGQAKYHDLGLIWQAYENLIGGRFDDPARVWSDLCERLPSARLWDGIDLYVYGFDTVRPDLREMILSAAPLCFSVSVALTMAPAASPSGRIFQVQRDSAENLTRLLEEKGIPCDLEYLQEPHPGAADPLSFLEGHLFSDASETFPAPLCGELSLFAASHPTAEALSAVSVLQTWHGEGIPWKRMAVALPGASAFGSALAAALRASRIPFFYSRKDAVSRHGVSRLLIGALACAASGFVSDTVLEMACCGFGPLSREEGSRLANYARAHGIEHGGWKRPFRRGDDAAEMEPLREKLIAPVERLHDALLGARDASAGVEAVFRFLEETGVHAQLTARQEDLLSRELYAEAVVDRQVWDLLMNLLDQLWALLGERRASLKEMHLLLSGALDRARLNALPEEEEGVLLGEIGHMLPGEIDALILSGMNDGVLSPGDDGLLSDRERKALKDRTGKTVGLDRVRRGLLLRSDYYRAMTLPEKRLRVSFCLRDENGAGLLPGEPVAELRRLFPLLSQEGGLSFSEGATSPRTRSQALEGLGGRLRQLMAGEAEDLDSPWRGALRALWPDTPAVREMVRRAERQPSPGRIPPETALRLFHGNRISISRLECYASCPYKHFLTYGLRPRLPEAFDFSALDAGDFFHLALQRFIDRASREADWPRLSEEKVNRLMDGILTHLAEEWADSPLTAGAAGLWKGEDLLRRARHAADVLTRFAANSDFRVVGTEMEFGSPEGLPPMILTLSDGSRVALRGKIDRMDAWRGPDGEYLRILDLKSSPRALDPAKMIRGEQLQLMIYLKAALGNNPAARPAGAFYFPVTDEEVDALSPEGAESERLKNVRLKGVVLREEGVLRATDRDKSPFSLDSVFLKDGKTPRANAGWALEEKTLSGLMDAAGRTAAALCEKIRSGEIQASPSWESDRFSACTYCDYRSFCVPRKEDFRPLDKGISFADAAASPEDAPEKPPSAAPDAPGKSPVARQGKLRYNASSENP